ncbi:hypothetical protein BN903_12 [Halorubrum sp. AJ67]|nr:hypothetical protein BN903_12 [Halorubrum sp. AJ67]
MARSVLCVSMWITCAERLREQNCQFLLNSTRLAVLTRGQRRVSAVARVVAARR